MSISRRVCRGAIARIGRRTDAVAVLSLSLFLAPVAALVEAQTASQITPPTFEPPERRLQGEIVFSGDPGLEAPEGADELSVTIADVVVEGGFPELAGTTRAIRNNLTAGPVPVSAIFQAAQTLETAYAQAGYVLARVVLPAQTLRDGGTLRLVVVDGFIEERDLTNVPDLVRPRIGRVTAPLEGQRGLQIDEIERRLLIAGATPGVAMTSALARGDQPGGTVLTLGAEHRPLTGFLAFDNTLSEELGDWVLSFGLEANSYFRLGEVIYVRASGHPIGDRDDDLGSLFGEDPQVRSLSAGAVFPIGTDGLTFNIEAVISETTPDIPDDSQTTSEFERVSFRLAYPWIRTREASLFSELILDLQSEELDIVADDDTLPISKDELTVLRLAVDGQRDFGARGALSGGAVVSFGLDALGARTADAATEEVPLSRAGADAVFSKLELAASYSRPLAEHLTVTISGRGQTSFGDPLVRSEQIGISSFSELSTFDSGSLVGDSGWVLRGDVLSPWDLDVPNLPFDLVTPYVFGAYGELRIEEPTSFESESVHAMSLGVGVELVSVIHPAFSDASLVVEYGRAFTDDDAISDDHRFTVVGSYRF